MGKATSIHNRKLSILHLFAAVVIQFLSVPHTASFAFSISGVYFLFEGRVTTVIPFVPLLPNGKNKCFLRFGFSTACFSSLSRRNQPDFTPSLPGLTYFGFFFPQQLNFRTPSGEHNEDNQGRLSQTGNALQNSNRSSSRNLDLNGQATVEFYRSQKSNELNPPGL